MKKLLTLIVVLFFVPMAFKQVEAVGVGGSIGMDAEVADFAPLIWMCDYRIVFDDNIHLGRFLYDEPGAPLLERMNNYAFEGEKIHWVVLVKDKNGGEKVDDVYVTVGDPQGVGNDIEVNCQEATGIDTIFDECNARIGEEVIDEFDPDTMAYYACIFTVETPDSMFGEYFVTAEVCDITPEPEGPLCNIMDENEFWFFNPVIALTIDTELVEDEEAGSIIQFGTVTPGTSAYSNTVLVGNGADPDSGVRLDMFISGTDFYDSSPSAAMCPTTNQLELGNGDSDCDVDEDFGSMSDHNEGTDPFCYFVTHGAYNTGGPWFDGRADYEGYVGIVYGTAFSTNFYDNAEIIQAGPTNNGYYQANILSPGSEMAITFRLNLPEPCNGNFDTGAIYFWGEAI